MAGFDAQGGLVINWKGEAVARRVRRACKRALKETMQDILADAREGSPVLTGKNRDSIEVETGGNPDNHDDDLTGAVQTTSGYGGYLEVGTYRMPPRPYIAPAVERNAPALSDKIRALLDEG